MVSASSLITLTYQPVAAGRRAIGPHGALYSTTSLLAPAVECDLGRQLIVRLVWACTPLVEGLARQYSVYNVLYEDLVQEGWVGVLKALATFDLAKGPLFTRHVRWAARKTILSALTDKSRVIRCEQLNPRSYPRTWYNKGSSKEKQAMSTVLYPDILIESPTKGPIAIVEVKNRQGLSPTIATELYESLSRYSPTFHAPYFMLLSQDTGFLWHATADNSMAAPQQFSMEALMERYLPNLPATQRLSGSSLELVVVHWLNELAADVQDAEAEPERSLSESGFLSAIRGARLTFDHES